MEMTAGRKWRSVGEETQAITLYGYDRNSQGGCMSREWSWDTCPCVGSGDKTTGFVQGGSCTTYLLTLIEMDASKI